MTVPFIDVPAAAARLGAYLPPTPLLDSPALACWAGHDGRCVLKCENLQATGSFKARGALNKILSLDAEERARGVVTASTGNHGRGVAHALSLVGGRGTVYLPTVAPANKVEALRSLGVEVLFHGDDSSATELHARRVAAERGESYVSPYNDPEVVAGQGTIAVELLAQCPAVDVVFVAVGGGGLAAGLASHLKTFRPQTTIVGCWPEHSQAMYRSMQAGRVVDWPELPTLSDGTAGGVEPEAITLDLCRSLIDDCVLVTEPEIADGVRAVLQHAHMAVEGAAGVAVAAYRRAAARYAGKTAAIVLCGGNIGWETLRGIVCAERT